jgi:hypothetical protein
LKRARVLALLLTGVLAAVSCKSVLSIEDAELDPTLGTGGTSGSSGSGGTSGSSGSSGSSGDSGAEASFTSVCDRYCTTVANNCQGDNEVYEDRDVCLATCARFEEGTEGERGNTVHCRIAAAEQAGRIEPSFYCPRASPGGFAPDDTSPCATNCESLCLLMEQVCNGDPVDEDVPDLFTNTDDCLADCSRVPDLGTFSTAPEKNQLRGNSVQCRLIHVANSTLSPADHCSHAAGQNTCVSVDGG